MPNLTDRKIAKPKASKQDVYQLVTSQIIAALTAGTVPWRRPWASGGAARSMSTGKAYRGVNPFLLQMAADIAGWTSPWFGTYENVTANGGQVRKGEKSTLVVFWKSGQRPAKDGEKGDADGMVRWATLRYFRVFNAQQADWPDGMPKRFQPVERVDFDPIEEAEAILAGYLKSDNAPSITFGGDRACYSPAADLICMPKPEAFTSAEAFYSTGFHEAGHSTGHKSRLSRDGVVEAHFFGDEMYAKEELVAEMTAAMLCGVAGIEQHQMPQSAAYIASWLKKLNDEPKMVVQAAAQAQKAADLILGTTFEVVDKPEAATEPLAEAA